MDAYLNTNAEIFMPKVVKDGFIRGFHCQVRQIHYAWLCGYLALPRDHPYYGRDAVEIESSAHGGLTYSEPYLVGLDPAELRQDEWWLGFDCAHSFDFAPGSLEGQGMPQSIRSVDYVWGELERLAGEMAAVSPQRVE